MFFRRALPVFEGGGRRRELIVLVSGRARRMRLAVDPRDGNVRLTVPKRTSVRQALVWAEERREWIETELSRLPSGNPLEPGGMLPIEGVMVTLDWRADASRTIRREGDRLILGGPRETIENRVLRWLRRRAKDMLDRETRELAALTNVEVRKVSVGDPRGRWGSCSSAGDIRYSWRLILAPPEVRRATVAHEVAHLLHMDHSPAFHAAVTRLFGRDPRSERHWLRHHGSSLHWIGRDG